MGGDRIPESLAAAMGGEASETVVQFWGECRQPWININMCVIILLFFGRGYPKNENIDIH